MTGAMNARGPSRRQEVAHLFGLDAVRVFALLLILVIHGDHWPLQQNSVDQAVWSGVDAISRASVPLFVILSGLLLTYRGQERTPLGTFVRRRLGRSLLPWAVWMPVYTLIGIYLTQEVPTGAPGILAWWLLGGGHLWYLILVPQLYFVFQLWPRSSRATAILAGIALVVQTGLCVYRLYAPANAPLNGLFLAYGYEFFFFWIGYFALGAALGVRLARHRPRWNSWPFWLAVVGGAALLVSVNVSSAPNAIFAQGTGAFLRPTLPILTVALFFAVALVAEPILGTRPRLRKVVLPLSRYSLGIYVVHEALAYIPGRLLAGPLLQRHLPLSVVGFLILVATTLGLASFVTRLIVATPLAITVGLPREPLPGRAGGAPSGEFRRSSGATAPPRC
jgi:surface polysaccharide O-acyltransferase-like enzyme